MPSRARHPRRCLFLPLIVALGAALTVAPAAPAGERQQPPAARAGERQQPPAAGVEQYTERLPSDARPQTTEGGGRSTLFWVGVLLVLTAGGVAAAVAVQRRRAGSAQPEL